VPGGSFDTNGNLLINQGSTVALTITPQFEVDPERQDTITVSGLNGATLSAGTVNQTAASRDPRPARRPDPDAPTTPGRFRSLSPRRERGSSTATAP